MGTVILPQKVSLEIVEVRLYPVTFAEDRRPGWKGYAYAEPLTEYCPCCNQPIKPIHAGKEQLTMHGAVLQIEGYMEENK
jgi:hypothetical protein